MTRREDGKETRGRLLQAACEIFSEKGYRRAKVADICEKAGANVASVNYYFRNKKNLYKEAWQYALENFDEPALADPAGHAPQNQLRHYIGTLIQNFTAGGDLERFSRLYLMEMVNPTGLIQDAWHALIEPRRRKLHAILRAIMGPDADDLRLRFCEMSIVNQCRMVITIKGSDLTYLLGRPLTPDLIGQLAQHIADFSLAGIQAVGEKQSGGR
jgi:TetR/AcrR family transcriptional regulator, regulator of cefoperazone and chloramphenicol sensitivity